MSERDPRTDPWPGDVLGSGARQRTVLDITMRVNVNYYTRTHNDACHIDDWRKWASTAEVVKVAPNA